jgi:hypothetical protein
MRLTVFTALTLALLGSVLGPTDDRKAPARPSSK